MIQCSIIERRRSPPLQSRTALRSEDSTRHLWHYPLWLHVFAYECRRRGDTRLSRSKLDSRQTSCLLIKMTDACASTADLIQTLTQLTAICSQCYDSKWHYGEMCGCETYWCAGRVSACARTSCNGSTRSRWFQYWIGIKAKWKQWQLIETNGAEVWCLSWDTEYGHSCNDIMLDKCHISPFVACMDIVRHTLIADTASQNKGLISDLFQNLCFYWWISVNKQQSHKLKQFASAPVSSGQMERCLPCLCGVTLNFLVHPKGSPLLSLSLCLPRSILSECLCLLTLPELVSHPLRASLRQFQGWP